MRTRWLILCGCVAAGLCVAAPRSALLSLPTGLASSITGTTTAVSGYIDEIILELPAGATTGTVAITATPVVGTNAVTLASLGIDATKLIRPRLDGTDTAGTALGSDPPGRYMSAGDNIAVVISDASSTGLTWRVLVKYDDGK